MTPITFRSKVDVLMYVIAMSMIAPLGFVLFTSRHAPTSSIVIVLATSALSLGFLAWLIASTRYTLAENALVVRSGPMSWTVAYSDIRSVRESSSLMSAPALSLDRLAIEHGAGPELLISPNDKAAFVAALRERCPKLLVNRGG